MLFDTEDFSKGNLNILDTQGKNSSASDYFTDLESNELPTALQSIKIGAEEYIAVGTTSEVRMYDGRLQIYAIENVTSARKFQFKLVANVVTGMVQSIAAMQNKLIVAAHNQLKIYTILAQNGNLSASPAGSAYVAFHHIVDMTLLNPKSLVVADAVRACGLVSIKSPDIVS